MTSSSSSSDLINLSEHNQTISHMIKKSETIQIWCHMNRIQLNWWQTLFPPSVVECVNQHNSSIIHQDMINNNKSYSCKLYYWRQMFLVYLMNKHICQLLLSNCFYIMTVLNLLCDNTFMFSVQSEDRKPQVWWWSTDPYMVWADNLTVWWPHNRAQYCRWQSGHVTRYPVSCMEAVNQLSVFAQAQTVCMCLTCRWRSPRTKCTWMLTA